MSFLALISMGAILALVVSRLSGRVLDRRAAMRIGMGGGFLFTGADHFTNAQTRYVPMVPAELADSALFWVYFTGVAELAGAVGLLIPVAAYKRLGLPNLQRHSGIGLALLLACVVWANIDVAVRGQQVHGLQFGAWYYWTRPLFQPLFIVWALYCSNAFSGLCRSSGPGFRH